ASALNAIRPRLLPGSNSMTMAGRILSTRWRIMAPMARTRSLLQSPPIWRRRSRWKPARRNETRLRRRQLDKPCRLRAACRPVQQLDRMDHARAGAILSGPWRKMCDATDVAGSDDIGLGSGDVGEFPITQFVRKVRLQDGIGTCRAATDM